MVNKNQHINIQEIQKLIPHRYPILLVDRVTEILDRELIRGIKNVTFNEPHFMGHFPDRPVMPGVLMVEALAQLSAIMVAKSMGDTSDMEIFFMAIDDTKFRRIVEPGDTLSMEASIVQNRGPVWKFKGIAKVGDEIAVESSFTAMVKKKENSSNKEVV